MRLSKMLDIITACVVLVVGTHLEAEGNDRVASRQKRVVGGNTASVKEFPWMAQVSVYSVTEAMHVLPESFDINHCGGVVLSDRWVVTAAHCFLVGKHKENKSKGTSDVNAIKVTIGSEIFLPHSKEQMFTELLSVVKQLPVYKTYRNLWRLYNNTFDVEKIVIHEEYNSNEMKIHSHDADLALIKVAEHLPLHKAEFATLPDNNTPSPAQEDRCLALGWGCTHPEKEGVSAHILQKVEMPMKLGADCSYWLNISMENKLCAGHVASSIGLCKGDSGGPLVCMQNDHWILYGLISVGHRLMSDQTPVAFTNLANYRDWIEQTMDEE